MTEKRLLIVAHAPSPNTRRLLNSVVGGARSPEIENVAVTALSPFDTGPDEVKAAQAIILGTTENLGYMSGALKDFFDRVYYPCLEALTTGAFGTMTLAVMSRATLGHTGRTPTAGPGLTAAFVLVSCAALARKRASVSRSR